MEGPLELASCLFESEEIIVIPIGIIISAIPIVLLFGTVLVTVLHRRDKRRREQQGNGNRPRQRVFLCWTIILGAGDALVIGFAVFVSCLFELNRYMIALYILAGLLLALLLIALMAQNLGKRAFFALLGCTVLAFGAIGGRELYLYHLRSITLQESFDFRSYTPFVEGSPVARLDETPALRFDDLDSAPRMDGATALYPVYAAFAQATYPESMAELESWQIQEIVACSTTSGAYRAIVNGDCDIIFVGGPSREQEEYAAEKGVELVYTPIGREAFVFFVNPKNPLEGLSLEQLRGIYSGQITDWSELGAQGLGEILAFQREPGSGSQTALERYVMQDTPLMPAAREQVIDGMGGIVEQVSAYRNHRNAIGYSFRFYCTGLMKGFDVKLLEINGVAPTVENIENGSYPLASCFYAVTRADADENTLALLAWICSPQGQALVEKAGYTPLDAGD